MPELPILVTGATGLVGNNVVRRLLADRRAVRVLSRATADPRPLAGLNVEIANGDVRDAAAVANAARGTQAIVHAAAYVRIGWTGLDEARAINVEGTRHVATAALNEGVKLVHVSSVDALGLARATGQATKKRRRWAVFCVPMSSRSAKPRR